jgi:chemotaxis protein methyltransferase WspC
MSRSSPNRDPREIEALRELLASKIGFNSDVLGPGFLESVMRRLEQARVLNGARQFLQDARAGGQNWEWILKEIVVSETWFFRDQRPFQYITERVADQWQCRGVASRIFSCPCSTGEEPYSVAIALAEAGLPESAFHIEAADVSPSAVRRAQAANFSRRSFRGAETRDLGRYFTGQGQGHWEVKPEFRRLVRFRVANLLDLTSVEPVPFDIVLCRNLLIYMHEDARRLVMSVLRALLADNGILIVGHAEAAVPMQYGFRPVADTGAFAFAPGPVMRATAAARTIHGVVCPPKKTVVLPDQPLTLSLEAIRELADQGKLEAATSACQMFVQQQPASAEAHYLLGVLLRAVGDESSAETALRRVLYLEPDHAGALEHLALAHDFQGNTARAHRLRSRMRVLAGEREQA